MQEIINLLKKFISEAILPDAFVLRYMELWKSIRDEQDEAIQAQPGLHESFQALANDLFLGKITKDAYERQWQKLAKKATGCRVRPGTQLDEILSHLFIEADAYCGEPEFREPYQISEVELRKETKKALEEMSRLMN